MTRLVSPACGSARIIPDAQLLDHDGTTRLPPHGSAPRADPTPGILSAAATSSTTRARVCGDCGLVELYAVDAGRMWAEHTGA